MESLFLSDPHYPRPTLRVHPLAAISITHAIMRQPYSYKSSGAAAADEDLITVRNHRVLGGLIGSIKENVVEIVDSFQVPVITEGDEVKLDEAYLVKMVDFFIRTNKREHLVGWYITSFSSDSTEDSLYDESRAINTIFAKHCYNPITEKRRNPIHLSVFMEEKSSGPGIFFKGYIGKNLTDVFSSEYLNKNSQKVAVAEKKLEANTPSIVSQLSAAVAVPEKTTVAVKEDSTWSFMFESLNVETVISDSEIACIHHLIHDQENASPWNHSNIFTSVPKSDIAVQSSLEKLLTVLGNLENYVTDVVEDKVAPIPEIGMQMSDIIGSMEAISKDSVEEVYRDRLHDMLMVGYLANLTKTQLQLADKIDSIL